MKPGLHTEIVANRYHRDGSTEIPRSGEFVQPDGRISSDEDFANNIEYFIFDPKHLRSVSPDIFNWLQTNLGKRLHLEKGCHASK